MKKILGWIIIVLMFLCLFLIIGYVEGFLAASLIFGSAILSGFALVKAIEWISE